MSTKIYLGSTTVLGNVFDFHNSSVKGVPAPVDDSDAAPKSYVDAQKTRIDTILTNASLDFDTMKEISDYAQGLKTSDISALNTNLSAEETRAKAAETTLTTNLSAEETRARAAETTLTTNLSTEVTRASAAETLLLKKIIKTSTMTPNLATIPDEQAPIVQPATLNPYQVPSPGTSFYQGWYFKNLAALKKINWYPELPYKIKVKDILGIYTKTFIINNTSNLFLTVYTYPTTDTANYASWYKAKQLWNISANKPSTGPTLLGAMNNNSFSLVSDETQHTQYQLLIDSSSVGSKGVFGQDDYVYRISIGSDSGAAAGNVEAIVQSIQISLPTGILEYKLYNSDVQQGADDLALSNANTALATRVTDLENQLSRVFSFFFSTTRDSTLTRV